ncbi:hypothetical protein FRC11_003495 [Ceratobasidium sp. 423]|nr:hypothetical protein FRC11_003495 [Ceratobasidium sp. 423]
MLQSSQAPRTPKSQAPEGDDDEVWETEYGDDDEWMARNNQELDNITVQVDQLIYDASKRIGVDVAELTGQFLAKSAATHEKKPTAWNGLVSKVSSELAYKKAEPKFRGATFMRYVVQYIHENKLYKDLTESKKEELVAYAQKVRDDQLSAGQTKTVDQ